MIWLFWIVAFLILLFGLVAFVGAPYVPSHRNDIRRAFSELYELSTNDFVVDIGSGDGVVLRQVSKLGGRGLGLEINPLLVLISNILSRGDKRVSFKLANYWVSDLPLETTVIYTFSVSRDIQKLANWVQEQSTKLNKPLYFISYGSEPSDVSLIKSEGASNLYLFQPLQPGEAQV